MGQGSRARLWRDGGAHDRFAEVRARAIVRDVEATDSIYERTLAEGRVVLVRLPFDEEVLFPEEETLLTQTTAKSRRVSFVGGRAALRRALSHFGVLRRPIMKDERGAPCLPEGFVGSISHKNEVAVALASRVDGFSRGVDVERLQRPKTDIASRILRDEELSIFESLPEKAATHDLLLRFSLKESIYKAIDPHLKRYVDYRECAVWPASNGEARVELFLEAGEPRLECHASWFDLGEHVITLARARVHR